MYIWLAHFATHLTWSQADFDCPHDCIKSICPTDRAVLLATVSGYV